MTPSLRWIQPILNKCTLEQPGIGIVYREISSHLMDPSETDFSFRWGAYQEPVEPTSILGFDTLVFIINPKNPLRSLSTVQLQQVFSKSSGTETMPRPGETTLKSSVQVWRFPDYDDIQINFEKAMGQNFSPSNYAFIAPDPQSMRQAVAENPDALGFIPGRWLNSSVLTLDLVDFPPESLRFPILTMTPVVPQAARENWLLCIKNNIKP